MDPNVPKTYILRRRRGPCSAHFISHIWELPFLMTVKTNMSGHALSGTSEAYHFVVFEALTPSPLPAIVFRTHFSDFQQNNGQTCAYEYIINIYIQWMALNSVCSAHLNHFWTVR